MWEEKILLATLNQTERAQWSMYDAAKTIGRKLEGGGSVIPGGTYEFYTLLQ